MKGNYPVFLVPDAAGYLVHVPDLPSCVTYGQDLNEAMEMAQDALNACLLAMEDHNAPIPTPSDPADFDRKEGSVLALVSVDTEAYRRQTDTKAVRRSVSMPSWMAYQAESRGISFSKVLQDGLRSVLEAS